MGEPRTAREERLVIGLLLLAFYVAGIGVLLRTPTSTPWGTTAPDAPLSVQVMVLAGATFIAAIAFAVHHLGVARGLKLMLREAWSGLLARAGLAIVTGFALVVAVPHNVFWVVLGPLYTALVWGIVWYASRAPRN
jgi:hypothetical protein